MSTIEAAVVQDADRLDGDRRVVAFAVFHVVIRVALGVAAIAAGVAPWIAS